MTAALSSARSGLRAPASALVTTTVVTLPAFLLGGLAVFVRQDLHIGDIALGALVSIYFLVGALSSVPVGRLVERFGSARTTMAGLTLGVLSLVGMALAAGYVFLLLALVIGGVGNAFGQLGSNRSLSEEVPAHRQGLAFGVKQAAVPGGTLLAGAAVPALGATIGWRWAFGLAAVIALSGFPLVPRRADAGARDHRVTGALPLVVIAVSATLAAGSANALSTFLVLWGVGSGLTPGAAAVILAVGGITGVAARVGSGWWADHRGRGHLAVVSLQLVGGAAGLWLIAAGHPVPIVIGTVLGYGLGWSWPGLLNYAIVRSHTSAPAAATSIVQVGVYAGGAVGPLGFGFLAETLSYPAAWRVAAIASCAAAVTLGFGAWLLRRHAR